MISVNAIACVQPYWAQHNGMLNSCLSHLGSERLTSLYAFKQMLALGASVAFSSDWPVSSHQPLKGISVAVNRRESLEQTPHNLGQALTLDQAIEAYTTGVQAMRVHKGTGLLAVGSTFDAVVLDADLFSQPSMDIARTSVLATYKAGKQIF
jgi:predicted amidohydrolase YtcJ